MSSILSRFALAFSACVLALATSASAQQVVFADDFESGLSNWTATGLWNLEDSGDPCGSQAAPFAQGTKAAWYGLEGQCDYDTAPSSNAGRLTLNDWVTLPVAPSISLRFWSWSHTEYCWTDSTLQWPQSWDIHNVIVAVEGETESTQRFCPQDGPTELLLPWHERRIDLSGYGGRRVKIAFDFGTVDDAFNSWLGWLIDDVRIVAEPSVRQCPAPGFASGCPCMPTYVPVPGGCRNSTQQSAVMYAGGSPSVSADTLSFRVEHMPPNASAILSQATLSAPPFVFGDGMRCAGGQIVRMGSLQASNGVATWPAPGTPSLAVRGGVPAAGGNRFYYVFYRDVQSYCTAAPYNITETHRVSWMP